MTDFFLNPPNFFINPPAPWCRTPAHERHTAKGTWGHRGVGIRGHVAIGCSEHLSGRSFGGSPHFSPIGSG